MGTSAKSFEGRSILGKVVHEGQGNPATAGFIDLGTVTADGELEDFIHAQRTAGVGGVYAEFQLVRTRGGVATNMLATQSRLTLAGGAGIAVDAKKKIAAVANCVRPALSATKANRRVKKGDTLHAIATYNGAYGTAPVSALAAVIKPDV